MITNYLKHQNQLLEYVLSCSDKKGIKGLQFFFLYTVLMT